MGWAEALPVAAFALIINAAHADCTFDAVDKLRAIGVKLRTVPAVAVTATRGAYANGVAYVPDTESCPVFVHEFVHHWQFEHRGPAADQDEWWARELQADYLTRKALRGD